MPGCLPAHHLGIWQSGGVSPIIQNLRTRQLLSGQLHAATAVPQEHGHWYQQHSL